MADAQYIHLPDGSYAAFPADLSDDKIAAALAQFKAAPEAPVGPSATDRAISAAIPFLPHDVSKGVAKGALSTASGLAHLLLPEAAENVLSKARQAAGLPPVSEMATADNPEQMIGKGLETAAELAIPAGMAAKAALPSKASAAGKFQAVMGAAKDIPLDVQDAGAVALKIEQLAGRGGTMPRAVSKFLARVTDPAKAPMNYEEGRDWASNISRLSVDDFNRLTPVIKREMAGLRVALNKANAMAASKAGKGAEYASAMKEYARALKFQEFVDAGLTGMKKGLPYAVGTGMAGGALGAGYWLSQKARSFFAE